jgi:hypothetical protein
MRSLTAFGLLTTLAACGSDSTGPTTYVLPVAPSASATCATFTPLARAVVDRTSLPAWLDAVARVIPGGYAGYDAARAKPTLLLVDTTQFTAAKSNIGALLLCPDFPSNLGFALPTDAVAAARYDFTRLFAWDHAMALALVAIKGVRNQQLDIAHNQIVLTVDDAMAVSAVRAAARSAGVPDDVVATVFAAR